MIIRPNAETQFELAVGMMRMEDSERIRYILSSVMRLWVRNAVEYTAIWSRLRSSAGNAGPICSVAFVITLQDKNRVERKLLRSTLLMIRLLSSRVMLRF